MALSRAPGEEYKIFFLKRGRGTPEMVPPIEGVQDFIERVLSVYKISQVLCVTLIFHLNSFFISLSLSCASLIKLGLTMQLSRVVYLFSRSLHDSSLNLTIRTTCARLLLNLVRS